MERRKFLIGAGSLAAGSAAAVGTGAFNFANVERDVSIDVVGDSSSFLALDSASQYANDPTGSANKLQLAFESDNSGTGINAESDYSFTGVFSITNQGSRSVGVWIEDNDSNDVVSWSATTTDDDPSFGNSIEGPGNAYALGTGDTIYVNVLVLLRGSGASPSDLPSTINVKADASAGN